MNINFFKNNYTAVLGSESGPGLDLGSRSGVCWTWTWGLGPGSTKSGWTRPGPDCGQSRPDRKLLDAIGIIWVNDPDDSIPIEPIQQADVEGILPSNSSTIHPYFPGGPPPATMVAGSRRSNRIRYIKNKWRCQIGCVVEGKGLWAWIWLAWLASFIVSSIHF